MEAKWAHVGKGALENEGAHRGKL